MATTASVSMGSQVQGHSRAAWFYVWFESELAAVQLSEADILITQAKYKNTVGSFRL